MESSLEDEKVKDLEIDQKSFKICIWLKENLLKYYTKEPWAHNLP